MTVVALLVAAVALAVLGVLAARVRTHADAVVGMLHALRHDQQRALAVVRVDAARSRDWYTTGAPRR